jgi:hypothetical protein
MSEGSNKLIMDAVINAVATALGDIGNNKDFYFRAHSGQFAREASIMCIKLCRAFGFSNTDLYGHIKPHPCKIAFSTINDRYYSFYSCNKSGTWFADKFNKACDLLETVFGSDFRKEALA